MSNTDRHHKCHMRTALGNCDPIGGFCTSVNESICEALHKVSRPQGEWIPCSERLPKRDELVLVTYKTTDRIHLCRYLDDGSENPWWSYIDDCCAWNNVVLAWMPLPKPYREDGEA